MQTAVRRKIYTYSLTEYTQAQWKMWALKVQNITGLMVKDDFSYTIWANLPEQESVEKVNTEIDLIYRVDLQQLTSEMRGVNGVEIKNRRYRFTVYPLCFIGKEGISWLQKKFNLSKIDAINLGQRLIDEKWLHHVCDEHDFEDQYFFYRFYLDE